MKNLLTGLILCICFNTGLWGQEAKQLPEMMLSQSEVEMHMRILASNEMAGRRTTDQGNNIAARYIAEHFRAFGIKPVDGADGYFQKIPFENRTPPKESFLKWNDDVYEHGSDMVVMAGESIDTSLDVVFVNFGWVDSAKGVDDYKGLDVKGKLVVSLSGLPDTQDPSAVFGSMRTKRKLAEARGAAGLIELYKLSFPWSFFKNYFGKPRVSIGNNEEEGPGIPYVWLKEKTEDAGLALKGGSKAQFRIKTMDFDVEPLPSQNVIGYIEGTDPVLKNEYILCTAHYDHVGTGKQGGGPFNQKDSIFNGARDNAMGTIALISAAKSMAAAPPKRSVIFIAFTGEEMGLLGSSYYADNPLIPLNQTVLNLNTDGAGYDDTTAYSVIGYGRAGLEAEFDQTAKLFGLKVIPDPAPEQNLYDRSDNVNFAVKGIPAPTISPGTTGFSEEIIKYYHQVADNPETINFPYLLKFCKAYSHLTRLVADRAQAPQWKAGDKYEAAGKILYEKK